MLIMGARMLDIIPLHFLFAKVAVQDVPEIEQSEVLPVFTEFPWCPSGGACIAHHHPLFHPALQLFSGGSTLPFLVWLCGE
jgi:hypothetical protein